MINYIYKLKPKQNINKIITRLDSCKVQPRLEGDTLVFNTVADYLKVRHLLSK